MVNDGTEQVREWCRRAGLQFTGLDMVEGRGVVVVSIDDEGTVAQLTFSELYGLGQPMILMPEQRICHVLHALLELVDGPVHEQRMTAIRDTAHQLSDQVLAFFRGELEPLTIADRLPF